MSTPQSVKQQNEPYIHMSSQLKASQGDMLQLFDVNHPWESRTVKDNVYNYITFEKYYWEWIDTPEFQRLRDIKQLGSTYLVYAGAVHNRFSHCLGTAHLGEVVMKQYQSDAVMKRQGVEVSDSDVRNVVLAGLLHDIGHGIYSHLFDRTVIPILTKNNPITWEHEDASVMMINALVDNNNIDIAGEDVRLIQELIKGEKPHNINEKAWLFDIVANKRNSIDIDKYDYIMRDAQAIGIKNIYFDYERLIKCSRVINNEICYNQKIDFNLYGLFQSRYKMFKDVYCHKVCQAMDYMIADSLVLANPYFQFVENIRNPDKYIHYTDNIITMMEQSNKPEFKKSKEILDRLRHRDIYRFVNQLILVNESNKKDITAQNIANCQDTGKFPNQHLTADDLQVHVFSLNYGCGKNNPMDTVKFFKDDSGDTMYIKPYQTSLVLPEKFSETYARLFVKDSNKYDAAVQAFKNYIEKFQKGMKPGLEARKNYNNNSNKTSPMKQYTQEHQLVDLQQEIGLDLASKRQKR